MAIVARRTHTTDRRSELKRTALRALAVAGVVGLSLLAAACGGGSSGAKVAQVGTTSSAKNTGSSNTSGSGNPTAWAACIRSHGVRNFPDPDSKGRFVITSSSVGSHTAGVDTNSSQFARAQRACKELEPKGSGPTTAQQAQSQQAMLKFARCMRAHGVVKFPDPKAGGALVLGTKAGVDPNTPQFKAAQQTCQKLVPGGPIAAAPPNAPPKP
jgi:hypothetical protein